MSEEKQKTKKILRWLAIITTGTLALLALTIKNSGERPYRFCSYALEDILPRTVAIHEVTIEHVVKPCSVYTVNVVSVLADSQPTIIQRLFYGYNAIGAHYRLRHLSAKHPDNKCWSKGDRLYVLHSEDSFKHDEKFCHMAEMVPLTEKEKLLSAINK